MPMIFAVHVDQRAARVAGIDGGVGLDERFELAIGNDVAADRRDDAGGNGFIQAEGTADGQHPVADVHAVGVAQLGSGQRLLGVDLDHREIGFRIGADHRRSVGHGLGIAHQVDANLVSLVDHVIVGEDVALGIDDHARAQRALAHIGRAAELAAALTTAARLSAEEAVKEILEGTIVLATAAAVGPWSCGSPGIMRWCGFLMVVSVLILTTVGSSSRAMAGKLIRHLDGRGNFQRRRVRRRVLLIALDGPRNDRANQNAQRKRRQDNRPLRQSDWP